MSTENFNEEINYQEAIEHIDRNLFDDFSKTITLRALEKQIPKKPTPSSGLYKELRGYMYPIQCPFCKCGLKKDADYSYCPNCGQHLDWSNYHNV